MDISGGQHLDVKHDIVKKRLDTRFNVIEKRQDGIGAPKIEKPLQRHGGRLEHNETYCGSCYGAEVEPIPVTQLVRKTASVMQEFTKSGIVTCEVHLPNRWFR